MDFVVRIGNAPLTVRAENKVLLKKSLKLNWSFMLVPNLLSLSHVDWLQLLVCHRLGRKLLADPSNSGTFVRYKQFQLLSLGDFKPLPIIFRSLPRQKEHPFPHWKAFS